MLTIFPRPCAGCQGATFRGGFCALCAEATFPVHRPCRICAQPNAGGPLCARCRQSPPPYEVVRACWEYDGAVADALRRVKYGGDIPALRSLCQAARPWFRQALQKAPPGSCLVALPSHPREIRDRGFHVPTFCLRHLREDRRGPGAPAGGALMKIRETEKQASLSEQGRARNVRGAFRYRGKTPPPGTTALLFDDVMTTGATAREATRALLGAGFAAVEVFVLARAGRD